VIVAKPSPLVLVSRVIPVVRIEAIQDYQVRENANDAYKDHPINLSQKVDWSGEREAWVVQLIVECWPSEPCQLPYRFRLLAVGVFTVQPGIVPESDLEKFVASNGPAVLYSSCREMLRTVTSAGPYSSIELPLAFFTLAVPKANQPQNTAIDTSSETNTPIAAP